MKKGELLARIEALEARVRALETPEPVALPVGARVQFKAEPIPGTSTAAERRDWWSFITPTKA